MSKNKSLFNQIPRQRTAESTQVLGGMTKGMLDSIKERHGQRKLLSARRELDMTTEIIAMVHKKEIGTKSMYAPSGYKISLEFTDIGAVWYVGEDSAENSEHRAFHLRANGGLEYVKDWTDPQTKLERGELLYSSSNPRTSTLSSWQTARQMEHFTDQLGAIQRDALRATGIDYYEAVAIITTGLA